MKARLLASLAGALVVAPLAWLLGRFFSGALFASVLAIGATGLCAGIAFSSGQLRSVWRRVAITAAVLLCGLAASLYTFGANEVGSHWSANAQLALAGFAALACGGLALALRHHLPVPVIRPEDDPDVTAEMAVTHDLPLSVADRHGQTMQIPALAPARGPMLAGVAVGVVLVLTTVYLIGGATPGTEPAHGSSQVANAASVLGKPGVGASAAFAVPVLAPGGSAPLELSGPTPADVPASGSAQTEVPAVTKPAGPAPLAGSPARRECMAQIESARLLLQLARQSESRTGYVIASESQISRILKEKPLGPRTLENIAERMWNARGEPDRDSAWWSSQFSKCESARRGGAYFIVRG